eukprot:361788-Chlamydomonas_euryale.AAC.1
MLPRQPACRHAPWAVGLSTRSSVGSLPCRSGLPSVRALWLHQFQGALASPVSGRSGFTSFRALWLHKFQGALASPVSGRSGFTSVRTLWLHQFQGALAFPVQGRSGWLSVSQLVDEGQAAHAVTLSEGLFSHLQPGQAFIMLPSSLFASTCSSVSCPVSLQSGGLVW